jgi:hypothetical protein
MMFIMTCQINKNLPDDAISSNSFGDDVDMCPVMPGDELVVVIGE